MNLTKPELRKIFKEKRSALSAAEITQKSQEINQNFLTNLLPKIYQKNSDIIFSLYHSSNAEVETTLIEDYFKKNKINFSYPKIIAKNQPLEFILYSKDQQLQANKIYPKVLEPISGEKIIPNIIILPLLAFDSSLTRLGMGGGFFDRTIELLKKDQNHKIITIGLSYEFQRFNGIIPNEKTDQSLDFIVTNNEIFL